jgi:diguanylate cyclase (GGDEF)-like protein
MGSRGAARGRPWAILLPVWAAGSLAAAAGVFDFAQTPRDLVSLLGIAALLGMAVLAERFPVPVEATEMKGRLSLSFVFGAAAIVLFGWAAGLIVVCGAIAAVHLVEHRPGVRTAYNTAVFAISAAAAGLAIVPLEGSEPAALLARVVVAYSVLLCVDIALIAAVMALTSTRTFGAIAADSARQMAVPAALMISAALMLVVLWERSPLFSVALIGPLLAIALYQRSQYRAVRAMRLAMTDPLTGLGNHRHFHERLQQELVDSSASGRPVTLCLLDIDDFKRVNDRDGHPEGDRLLAELATRLRQGGEAFRLGGDEFAVVLPGHDASAAYTAAAAIVERISSAAFDLGPVTVSAGVATFPSQGVARDELIRLADSALYWAKEHGKNQVRVYRPDVIELAALKRLASGPDRAARYRAAARLARAVDARDAYGGSHSERVADLSGRLAARLGADPEHVELTRLAASLHDLGKLAIPEEILRKPGPLTAPERGVLERHPQIGFRMLETLGVDPVAEWVLRHHERWDGTGYPDGLAREQIPLPARIISVVGAYDAMTSQRGYRDRLSEAEALDQLEEGAGTQFDPRVVAALAEELCAAPALATALAS